MALAIDLVIVLIFLIIIWRSAVHGFVRTVIEMVGYILAALLTLAFTGVIAETIYDYTLNERVTEKVQSTVSDVSLNMNVKVNEIWDGLPSFVTKSADLLGSSDKIKNDITTQVETSSAKASSNVSQKVVRPIFVNILKAILSIIMFTALMFLVRFIAKTLNRMFSFSILGSINALLGGTIGFAKGIVIVGVLLFVIKLGMQCMHGSFMIFNESLIAETKLFKILFNFIRI